MQKLWKTLDPELIKKLTSCDKKFDYNQINDNQIINEISKVKNDDIKITTNDTIHFITWLKRNM